MRVLSFLLLLCGLPAIAQEGHHGPRVGLGMATQSVGGIFSNTSDLLLGPIIGWHFEVPVHTQVSITPEVLWMTKGFVVRNPAQATRSRSTFRYLEVPLLAKISMDKEPNGLFLLVGPSVGYFLSGRYKTWQNGQLLQDYKYDLSTSQRRLQFSAVAGLGIEGPRWGFDVRAQSSVTPFDRVVKVQNVVYALTVAYRISGRGKERPEPED